MRDGVVPEESSGFISQVLVHGTLSAKVLEKEKKKHKPTKSLACKVMHLLISLIYQHTINTYIKTLCCLL